MAVPVVQSGASPAGAPLLVDEWQRLHVWELDDGLVSLYRKGNELYAKFSGANDRFKQRLDFSGDIEERVLFLQSCSPMRIADTIRFISANVAGAQVPSAIDPTVMITHRMWAVTFVAQTGHCTRQTERGPRTDSSGSLDKITGHAYLYIETLNVVGIREAFKAHIITGENILQEDGNHILVQVPHKRAKVKYEPANVPREEWNKTEPIRRSSTLVQRMIDDIQRQVLLDQEAEAAGQPLPIRYSAKNPRPQEGIQNCDTWVLQQARIATIALPEIEPPLLPGKGWYMPVYQIRPIREICEIKVNQEGIKHHYSYGDYIIHAVLPWCMKSLVTVPFHVASACTLQYVWDPETVAKQQNTFDVTVGTLQEIPREFIGIYKYKKQTKQEKIQQMEHSIKGE